jgi:hypothetical protein
MLLCLMFSDVALFTTQEGSTHAFFSPNSFIIRTSEKRVRNPFRIRTSKTRDLKPFRIRTYEKNVFFCLLRLTRNLRWAQYIRPSQGRTASEGGPYTSERRRHPKAAAAGSRQLATRFVPPLFSYRYELLFSQPVSLYIHTNCRGYPLRRPISFPARPVVYFAGCIHSCISLGDSCAKFSLACSALSCFPR